MVSNTAFQYMILALVVLVLTNVVTMIGVFATGVGKRVLQRMKQRWMYKWGKHVNTIFIRRNHVSHELFIKKEADGSFLVDDKKYTVNPLATFVHDGIPTQINLEGDAEAFNIFSDPRARDMSTAELENVIMSNENDGTGAYLKKVIFWLLVLIGIAIICAGAAAYYGYTLNDYIIKKQALQTGLNAVWIAAQNATNSVGVITPR